MYQIDPSIAEEFLIRSHAVSDIMAGSTLENGLTSNQKVELDELLTKQASGGKGLTVKQMERLSELSMKFNAKPELPSGAKTHCQKWLKRRPEMYNRRKDMSTAQTEKGLITEDDSIDFIADFFKLGFLMKNEEFFPNEYMCGTPDVIIKAKNLIIDNKSSWDHDTFPLFEKNIPDSRYWWQAQSYMELVGLDHYWLIYTLMDTPMNIIERECKSYSYRMGYGEVTEGLMKEFIEKMTYKNIPEELKIKRWTIQRDRSVPAKIEARVKMCRTYLRQLITEVNNDLSSLESF